MDPTTTTWLEIAKLGGGTVVGAVLVIKVIDLIKFLMEQRGKTESQASDAIGDLLKRVDETNRQALSIHERSLKIQEESSKAYLDGARVMAEEARQTRLVLDSVVREVPAQTRTIMSPSFEAMVSSITDVIDAHTHLITEQLKEIRELIARNKEP